MKYIIIYCIKLLVSDPCPNECEYLKEEQKIFGGKVSCAVFHGHSETICDSSKVFNNPNEAYSFYIQKKKESNNYGYHKDEKYSSIRIDTIKI